MIEAGTIAELIGGIDTWCQKNKSCFLLSMCQPWHLMYVNLASYHQMNVTIVLQAMILNLCQEHGSLRGLTARHFFWRICLSCSHQSCWFNLSHEHSGDSLSTFAALGVQALRASLLKVVVRLFSPVWPLTAVRSPWRPCGRSRKWLLLPVGGRPSFLMNGWRQMVGKPGKGLVGVSVSSLNVGTLWNISNCVEWSLQEISEGNQRRLEDALDLLDYGAQKPLLRYRTESNSFPQMLRGAVPSLTTASCWKA